MPVPIGRQILQILQLFQLLGVFHTTEVGSQSVNFIRVSSPSRYPASVRIRKSYIHDGHLIGSSGSPNIPHSLLGSGARDGNLRRGLSALLRNYRRSGNHNHDFGDLHLHSHHSSGGHEGGVDIGDLRDLIQQGRGVGGSSSLFSGSGSNSGDLQSLLQRGRGAFGNFEQGGGGGSNFNFGSNGGGRGFPNIGGRTPLLGRGPWMQLFLDKTRFFGMGTRLLVHQGRLLSEVFGHVIHGVSNITERLMGTGEGGNSLSVGNQQNFGRPHLDQFIQRPGGEHGSVVNFIDIVTHHDGPHHGGHFHTEHHHPPHRDHLNNGQHYIHQRELSNAENFMEQEPAGGNYNEEKRELEESFQKSGGDTEEYSEYPNTNVQEIDHHHHQQISPEAEQSNYNDQIAPANQMHDGTQSLSVLKIPPFKPMPDWSQDLVRSSPLTK